MGYDWKELQRLLRWDDVSMQRLKKEYDRIIEEEGDDNDDDRPRFRRVPRRPD